MVKITVYMTKDHVYMGFDAQGHAGFSTEGNDVVCAAVSVLVINTVNSIESFTEDRISCVSDETDGSIEFRFSDKPSRESELLIRSMLLGLESMEDNREYEPYIDIIFKEV